MLLLLAQQTATTAPSFAPTALTNTLTNSAGKPLIPWQVWPVIGYLFGCISFAWIIGRAHGVDLMREGSRNLGATNVGRVLGAKWGYLCFLGDALKGFIPVVAGGLIMGWFGKPDIALNQSWCWLFIGIGAMLGHMFPFWLKFKGGKGVATGLGVLLGFWPWITIPAAAAFALWILLVLITRYISVGSLAAAAFLPFFVFGYSMLAGIKINQVAPFLLTAILMSAMVIVRHRGNIKRLKEGTETKIGAKKAPQIPQ
jgi:acyl phosphate:glycerol-3-phosphate acyltransferase